MKEIPLNRNMVALVDDEDYERASQWNWTVFSPKNDGKWYALTHADGETSTIAMHTLILGKKPGFEIDHINNNGLDNRKSNLRFATSSQNKQNMRKHKGSSKYKGVTRRKNRWEAYIVRNYKQIHLGSFLTEMEAAQAYNEAAIELFGEFAKLNKVREDF